jgi:hypothetical protein
MKITITEALAEIKTINKRLINKRETVLAYLTQPDSARDPLEGSGGSKKFIEEERQAIDDLVQRIVTIRGKIARSNDETIISINGKARSLTEWLAWKRDTSALSSDFLDKMRNTIQSARNLAQTRGMGRSTMHVQATIGGDQKPGGITVYLDEASLNQELEEFTETLAIFDGQLSLKNATTTIELN